MAEDNKRPSVFNRAVEKVLPLLDSKKIMGKAIGKPFGITEEDRKMSKLMEGAGVEERPASHKAVEGAAYVASAAPEFLAKFLKFTKELKAINKAAENADAFEMLGKGIKGAKDYRVLSEMSKAGNAVNDAGVNAAKSIAKNKIVKNTAKKAWKENKNAAKKILNDANDAAKLSEVIKVAEPSRVKEIDKLVDYVDEMEDKLSFEDMGKLNSYMKEEYDKIIKRTFDDASKAIAGKKAEKAGLVAHAINQALSAPNRMGKMPEKEAKPLYAKPKITDSDFIRAAKIGVNRALSMYLNLGTNPDEWDMDAVNELLREANKDGYLDQDEIDGKWDEEKIWLYKKIGKGKLDSKDYKISEKLRDAAIKHRDSTNNTEDNK